MQHSCFDILFAFVRNVVQQVLFSQQNLTQFIDMIPSEVEHGNNAMREEGGLHVLPSSPTDVEPLPLPHLLAMPAGSPGPSVGHNSPTRFAAASALPPLQPGELRDRWCIARLVTCTVADFVSSDDHRCSGIVVQTGLKSFACMQTAT